jgi:dipeptidyl aminopeptidase/acylaminoacyl peptidase
MDIVVTILQVVCIILSILVGLFVLEAAIVTFIPGMSVPKQPLGGDKTTSKKEDVKPPRSRKDVTYRVKGTAISAWLYLPENLTAPVPCIVMGHGFGGTKDILLERYAVRYQDAGYAVLTFDYRHFGESEGEPR